MCRVIFCQKFWRRHPRAEKKSTLHEWREKTEKLSIDRRRAKKVSEGKIAQKIESHFLILAIKLFRFFRGYFRILAKRICKLATSEKWCRPLLMWCWGKLGARSCPAGDFDRMVVGCIAVSRARHPHIRPSWCHRNRVCGNFCPLSPPAKRCENETFLRKWTRANTVYTSSVGLSIWRHLSQMPISLSNQSILNNPWNNRYSEKETKVIQKWSRKSICSR